MDEMTTPTLLAANAERANDCGGRAAPTPAPQLTKGALVPETDVRQARNRIREQFDDVTPEKAEAKITASPTLLVYEAKFALQQLTKHIDDAATLAEIIEPLARAVGWAEASAFMFDRQAAGSVGTHVPAGNGSRQVRT